MKNRALVALIITGAILLPATMSAHANPIPEWDHYTTYLVANGPNQAMIGVYLSDQFSRDLICVLVSMEDFGAPAFKDGGPIFYPDLHYTWWRIDDYRCQLFPPEPPHQPGWRVMVNNQFGEQELQVGRPRYLWNPALVVPGPGEPLPTDANHYWCYDALGQAISREVTLQTRFGTEVTSVMEPEVFCNPARKTDLATGREYPIVDPAQHYVCYRLDPVHPPSVHQVPVMDQFFFQPLYLTQSRYLCVPSFKTGVVAAQPGTWGRVKAHYR